jgi:hypothetical protein
MKPRSLHKPRHIRAMLEYVPAMLKDEIEFRVQEEKDYQASLVAREV